MKMKVSAAALLLLYLTACANLGLVTPQSFSERLATGYTSVSTVRSTATALLAAKRISVGDATNVQASADNARAGLDIARDIHATEPAAADARLTSVITALTALSTYLEARK